MGPTKARLFAIFDLDSTLLDVQPRIAKIMKEFSEDSEMCRLFPVEAEVLGRFEVKSDVYHMREHLEHFGLTQQSPEFYKTVFHFWKERFFSDEYLKYDVPYAGAVEYVQALADRDAEILYLTGRDHPRMGKGTVASLQTWNFPLDGNRWRVDLKPHHSLDDAEFKRDYLIPFQHGHGPIWFFENELENIALVQKASPHIGIVFFDSIHSGKGAPISADVPKIQDFRLQLGPENPKD
jgi:hypothetical protein